MVFVRDITIFIFLGRETGKYTRTFSMIPLIDPVVLYQMHHSQYFSRLGKDTKILLFVEDPFGIIL